MKVSPYINFNGNCEEALNFYAEALNAKITELKKYEGSPMEGAVADTNKIMHARLNVGSDQIMFCDGSGDNLQGDNISLSIEFSDVDDMNAKFAKLANGGKVTMELQDTFWGARFGMLTDKFGIHWMFNCELKK